MKKIVFIVTFMVLMMITSCGNNAAKKAEQARFDSIARADSVARADSIARVDSINKAIADSTERVEAAIAFITDFYNSKKFENESFLNNHCSAEVLKKLINDCDYEGGGYATWDFRSDFQDGPSERHEIISVEPLNDNWYLYTFYDMGNKGSHKIRVIQKDEDFVIDGIQ